VSPDFYVNTGSKVILLAFIGIFLPHIQYFMTLGLTCLYNWLRNKINKTSDPILEKEDFALDGCFVGILTTIATALTFSSIIPILIPLAWLTLFFFVIIHRWILVRWSPHPKIMNSKLINVFVSLLPFMIIGHAAFSIMVFGDWTIFMDENGKKIWEAFLESGSKPSFKDDMMYRGKKNIALIVICGYVFILLVVLEIIYYCKYYGKFIDEERNRQMYAKGQSLNAFTRQLEFNSGASYDYREQEELKPLLKLGEIRLQYRSGKYLGKDNRSSNKDLEKGAKVYPKVSEKNKEETEIKVNRIQVN